MSQTKPIKDLIISETDFFEDQDRIFKNTEDFHPIKGEAEARNLIIEHIKNGSPIINFTDYDFDGVNSGKETKILVESLGSKRFKTITGKTKDDGYGFQLQHAEKFTKVNPPGLLILTDNGIKCHDAIQAMRDAGWDVIILDHHLPLYDENDTPNLPNANVVIDPEAIPSSCDFHHFCGAGLVYHLAQSFTEAEISKDKKDKILEELLPYAGLATLADVVDLIECDFDKNLTYTDNWKIVNDALIMINDNKMPILYREIIANAGKSVGYAKDAKGNQHMIHTAKEAQFTEIPCVNSLAKRSEDQDLKALVKPETILNGGCGGQITLKLLSFEEPLKVKSLAEKIIALNNGRKVNEKNATEKLKQYIIDNNMQNDYPIVVSDKSARSGICGTIAAKLLSEFNTSVIVIQEPSAEDDKWTGSARGLEGGNLAAMIDTDICSQYLVAGGGHECAAGLELESGEYLDAFREAIQSVAGKKPEPAPQVAYLIDKNKTLEFMTKSEKYGPYGKGHELPVVLMKDLKIESVTKFKTGGEKYVCDNGLSIVNFFAPMGFEKGDFIDCAGTLEFNYFRENLSPQMEVFAISEHQREIDAPEKADDFGIDEDMFKDDDLAL